MHGGTRRVQKKKLRIQTAARVVSAAPWIPSTPLNGRTGCDGHGLMGTPLTNGDHPSSLSGSVVPAVQLNRAACRRPPEGRRADVRRAQPVRRLIKPTLRAPKSPVFYPFFRSINTQSEFPCSANPLLSNLGSGARSRIPVWRPRRRRPTGQARHPLRLTSSIASWRWL